MARQRGIYLTWIVSILLAGAVITADYLLLEHALEDGFYRIVAVVSLTRSDDTDEKREIELVLAKTAADEALARENAALRRQLEALPHATRRLALARVIALERNGIVSFAWIDHGRADGIAVGMAVVSSGNMLAGRVSEAREHTAQVTLIDDPRLAVSTRALQTSLLVQSRGAHRGKLVITLVSHTETLSPQTLLVTSGLDGFPEGLVLGRVTSMRRGSDALFQDVQAKALFDFGDSSLVFVVL